MEDLVYITGNYGKYISVKEKFAKNGLSFEYFKCDLDEPDINDIEVISKEKARQAYEKLKKPVFVTDSGFYIENYPDNPGYPGAFVKRTGISSNISKLLETMKNVSDRTCYFLDCLTFYDGNKYFPFFGVTRGTLSYEKRGTKIQEAKSNLWYVFIPSNCSKTLAEMTGDERSSVLGNIKSATDEFITWYKTNCLNAQFKQNEIPECINKCLV